MKANLNYNIHVGEFTKSKRIEFDDIYFRKLR